MLVRPGGKAQTAELINGRRGCGWVSWPALLQVFVIERKTFIDGVWHRAMAPTDLILATGPGT